MAKIDYLKDAFLSLKIIPNQTTSIGTANLINSDAIIDECVLKRMSIVADIAHEAYANISDELGLNIEQTRQLMTYTDYLNILKSVGTISGKIAEAERALPRGDLRTGNPLEDKHMAAAIEKRYGYNPSKDWSKIDKQQENAAKLYSQYSAVQLQLVRSYNSAIHTADRNGYKRFLNSRDTAFMSMLDAPYPISPMSSESRRHAYITGGSGSGKSELLKVLIHAASQREGEAVVVIDPHGDLVSQVAQWKEFKNSDRLLYIDPYLHGEYVPPFNPLDVPSDTTMQEREVIAQQLVNAFEQLLKGSSGDGLTVNMRTILTPCVLTLLDRPNSTLADLQRFVNDSKNQQLVALGTQSKRRAIAEFFKNDFVNDTTLQTSKTAVSRKLQSLFNTYAFDEVVNSKSSIDLVKAVDSGKVILFNLAKGRLGDEASEAFGRLIVASIQGLALRRADIPENERVQINLFIDECQNYISPATIQILEEARKYAVNMTLAQQVVGRGMSAEVRTVVMNNTNIKVVGRTPEDDKMAKILGKTQAEVQQLATGSFWMKVGNGETFMLKARSDLVGDKNAMTSEEWQTTVNKILRHYRPIGVDKLNPLEAVPDVPQAGNRDLV